MRVFVLTVGAVFVGILIYANLTKKTAQASQAAAPGTSTLFQGPDIDPVSGAYLPPGAKVGTVQFGAQGN